MTHRIIGAALAALLIVPAGAAAHVTIQPRELPAGGFTRIDVRVPNERDDAGTKKVDVQMPPGFAFVSYEPEPGWSTRIERRKLDEPIEIEEGFEISEEVTRVTFTAEDEDAVIGPGEFRDFGLSVRMPDGAEGDKLTFKALQTYEGGEIVRWIGPEDGDEPAPVVTLAASQGGHGDDGEDGEAGAAGGHGSDAAAAAGGDDGDSDLLPIIALVVGGLGLAAGVAALGAARRSAAPSS